MSNYTCKHDYISVPPDKHDCPECLATNKPAQSDAPSAEPEFFEHPNGSFSFRGSLVSLTEMEIAEAYAALRTAKISEEKEAQYLKWFEEVSALNDRERISQAALSEARARTIKELIEVAEISAKLLAEQEAEIAKALPNADGFVAGGVAMATRLAEGFRALLAGASGAADALRVPQQLKETPENFKGEDNG